ncbi:MAG: type II toxin-antitoxin system VapC family toxin [Chthonomonadales bacterium]
MSEFVLVDTNILLRSCQIDHPMHLEAVSAQRILQQGGYRLCVLPQNIWEFRTVATKPTSSNGVGMNQIQADGEIVRILSLYSVFEDTPKVFEEWRRLVSLYGAQGKQNHDTRIAAAMIVHGIKTILTFNTSDFLRYSELHAFSPPDVIANQKP